MAELTAGTLIDGRYRLQSRLGSGGMADVFLGEDEQLGRKVAIKLLHRRFAEDPGFVERFRREAQAAAGLQHPNIVSVYDRGSFDGTYYIAMEYVPGRSLKQLIRQEAPIDPVRAIDITIQILKAARFAHRHGVIHRDLKPHNAIIDDSGHVKVTDFGIARAGASDMTETGSIMGTAQYLSPEQAQGHAVSASSDLYSVGVVLYELLTGRVPFDADSAVTIALKHVSEAPNAPTLINPRIPPNLEHVVMWTLNKNAADRPKTADELITALENAKANILAGNEGQRTAAFGAVPAEADPALAAVLPVEGDGAGAPPPEDARRPWWKNRRLWLVVIALLAAAGVGTAIYFLVKPAQKTVPPVVGEQFDTARTVLQNAGFSVSRVNEASTRPAGFVFAQSPNGGTNADKGSTVQLTVSSGPPKPGPVSVPNVVGESLPQAQQDLSKLGLKNRVVSQASSQPANQVLSQTPNVGQSVQTGSTVTLTVSNGKVAVPSVVGQTESSAKSALANAGFTSVTTSTQSSSQTPGTVLSQTPAGGTTADPTSTTVNLVIAQASTIPNVVGQNRNAATSALQKAGFAVSTQTQTVTNKKQDGVVLSQSPSAGTSANPGSSVTITVGQFNSPTTTTGTTTTPTTGH
ncbi:MAG TPA: Stk1 family PASTA domain-containing Ser/Thr kinase [Solirubrobacteraceae bacterium]|nr:Stk1 family PASTA domain-containing Ser/Thr kinase [Solirubrobacteraceae bacterium]